MIFRNIGNLKVTPKTLPFCCLLIVLTLTGCLGGLQTTATQTNETASTAETETPQALAVLQISTPKANYAANEAIPLNLNIQNGKFDLLVPFVSVATRGAFSQITVTDANGQTVEPQHLITQENPQKYVVGNDGKNVRCVQGFQLKAAENQELLLKDIQKYYQLPPGTYTLTLAIDLEVYQESITEEHPEVLELRKDLARIQNDPNLQAAAKQDAVNYYQEQIKFIQERHKDVVKDIYLPIKSRRGKVKLVSNGITLTVEPETNSSDLQKQDETPPQIDKSDAAPPKKQLGFADIINQRASERAAPKYKTRANPQYPKSAKEAKKDGTVILQLTIDENGIPKNIVALTNLGFGLEAAAIEALKNSTFHPAMKNGKPISKEVEIPYAFKIEDAASP